MNVGCIFVVYIFIWIIVIYTSDFAIIKTVGIEASIILIITQDTLTAAEDVAADDHVGRRSGVCFNSRDVDESLASNHRIAVIKIEFEIFCFREFTTLAAAEDVAPEISELFLMIVIAQRGANFNGAFFYI